MKAALILHGMPSKEGYYDPKRESQSNEHWLPWLQRQLLLKDILTQTPEWPKPYAPDYKAWADLFNRFHIDEDTILIGHSCAGGFLVRWLSGNKVNVDKVILVAPWMNPDGHSRNPDFDNAFFDFEIDPTIASRTKGITVFYSTDDNQDILATVELIKKSISGVKTKEFAGMGHFTFNDMHKRDFPELLEEVL